MTEDDDIRDAMLFRFWCRAASYPGGWPQRLMDLFHEERKAGGEGASMTADAYRRALTKLAHEKGVNLP